MTRQRRRTRRSQPPLIRAIAVGLSTCAVLLATGLPLPAPPVVAVGGASGERFPCEHCRCGCRTADHCWRRCCCHTLEQRLAWARREGVTPPAFVVARAREQAARETKACCANCRSAEPRVAEKRPAKKRTKPLGVTLVQALACQGLDAQWLAVGVGPVPTSVVAPDFDVVEWASPTATTLLVTRSEAPGTPPPEIAA